MVCRHQWPTWITGADHIVTRRRLDYRQKDQYIAAVKCLLKKPGTAPIAAVKNRYEDFVAAHQAETDVVHFVVCEPCLRPGPIACR